MLPSGGLESEEMNKSESSALDDGQNGCPKHTELIGIVNKLLLLHLVGYLYHSQIIMFD
jgi:hypothetical protein